MIFFWIVLALAFAVAEVVTLALFAVFLVVAALGGALAAGLGGDLLWQGFAFFVLAIGGIFVARPLLMRYLERRRAGPTVSGAQEMIGTVGVVTDDVRGALAAARGHVRIMGERWPAVSADDSTLKAGREVEVVDIRGATLVVASEQVVEES